ALLRGLPLLGRHGLLVTVVLEHARALLGREAPPSLEIAFGDPALLRRESLEPLDPRRLTPCDPAHPGQHEHDEDEQSRHPAGLHGYFTSLEGASVGVSDSRTCSVFSTLSCSTNRIRVRRFRSRARSASFMIARSSSICASSVASA